MSPLRPPPPRLLASLLLAAIACAPAPAEPNAGLAHAPITDRDPLPYTPPAGGGESPGRPIGLLASGESRAREIALRALEAIANGDGELLEFLLAPRLGRAHPTPTSPTAPRQAVLRQIQRLRGRIGGASHLTLSSLAHASGIHIVPLAQRIDGRIPEGLLRTDLVVTVPLRDRGREIYAALLGGRWSMGGSQRMSHAVFVIRGNVIVAL